MYADSPIESRDGLKVVDRTRNQMAFDRRPWSHEKKFFWVVCGNKIAPPVEIKKRDNFADSIQISYVGIPTEY